MRRRLSLAALALAAALPALGADAPADPEAVAALLQRARLWEARNRGDLAREALDRLFRVAPDDPEGLALLAELQIKENDREAAARTLARLKSVSPAHPAAARVESLLRLATADRSKLRQARQLARGGRTEAALAALKSLYPDGPPSGELALEYWQLVAATPNGWEPARAGLIQLAREYPDNLRYRLALAEHETSRAPVRREALRTLAELAGQPAVAREARAAWGRAVRRLDFSESSLPLLQAYLAEEPGDSAVREKLAATRQALEARRRLLADPAWQARLAGLALLDGGRLDAAEDKLAHALAGRPGDPEAVGGMGLVRLRQGYHAEARGYFQRAAGLDPGNRGKWNGLYRTALYWGLLKEAGDARVAGEYRLAEEKLAEARKVDPGEPNALVGLARLRADQKRPAEAEAAYREALTLAPASENALSGLLGLYFQLGREAAAEALLAGLPEHTRRSLGGALGGLRAGLLREKAARAQAGGRPEEAVALLEEAIALAPEDPWLRYSLARLYAGRGEPALGRALFDPLVLARPDDPAVLHALALYQASLDQEAAALASLERVPAGGRTAGLRGLQRRLWISVQVDRARALAARGDSGGARDILERAQAAAEGDDDLATQVAYGWGAAGDYPRARRLLAGVRGPESRSAAWRLRYAGLLAGAGAEDELSALLEGIAAGPLSGSEREDLAELRQALALARVDALRRAGNPAAARQLLKPLLAAHPDRAALLEAEIRLQRAQGNAAAAAEGYRRILALAPEDDSARLALVDLLLESGERREAEALVGRMLAREAADPAELDVSTRIALADAQMAMGDFESAERRVAGLLARAPRDPRLLALAGQLARRSGRVEEAVHYLQESLAEELAAREKAGPLPALSRIMFAPAGGGESPAGTLQVEPAAPGIAAGERLSGNWRRLAELEDRRQDWLAGAMDWRQRSGTPGLSRYDALEIPLELKRASAALGSLGEGQVFFRADLVRLDAGAVDLAGRDGARFGSTLACQPACPGQSSQTAAGVAFNVGFERPDLRLDFGTTPLGFAVAGWSGGIRKKGDLGSFSYSVDISRRPLTGSLLSYAGTRDPNGGAVWGGVQASGARFGLSWDQGGDFGFWSSLGLHRLAGRNVAANDRLQLMAGGYWRLINEDDRLLSVGLTGMYWRHSANVGEYTFGHGGYYSPELYRSLALPVSWSQRSARFSYLLRGAVSRSWSKTAAADYFPTDAALQAAARALSPLTGVDPRHSAGTGGGTGWAFAAAWEYQFGPRLYLGGRLDIERSEGYAPDRLLFYFRHALGASGASPVFLPPEPVSPTSQF